MAISQNENTTNGLLNKSFVRFTLEYYRDRGLMPPVYRRPMMITGIIRSNASGERVELMWSQGEENGYIWASPEELEHVNV